MSPMGGSSSSASSSSASASPVVIAASPDDMVFSNVAGLLPSGDKDRFTRMLFRATRGNCFVRFAPLNQKKALDAEGKPINKLCFIIFFKSSTLEGKIKRICDAFLCNRYDLSNLNNPEEMEALIKENEKEIAEAKKVIDLNTETKKTLCTELAQFVEEWMWIVKREKSTYHTLNLFKPNYAGPGVMRGKGWILTSQMAKATRAIKRGHRGLNGATYVMENVQGKWPTPPTHFICNEFQYAFQAFVNTYGIPRYKEINPALFTAATFPFLFGVMYGDVGHGSCLALFGLYLILTSANAHLKTTGEMLKQLYTARYMLFMMGCGGIYAGLVYNDYFSLGLNLFGTRYSYPISISGIKAKFISFYGDEKYIYPFGVDPIWKTAENELLFYNSMKMKMSVILGIIQMIVGICLRGLNSLYFKSWVDLICEFVPMIIFAVGFFGYMVILIFVKWSIDWDKRMALGSCSYDSLGNIGKCTLDPLNVKTSFCYNAVGKQCTALSTLAEVCPLGYGGTSGGCQPPNLITTLINIALSPGNVVEPMYAGQGSVQSYILLAAFFCVPWLLCVKPFYLKYTHKPSPPKATPVSSDVEASPMHPASDHGHGHAVVATNHAEEEEEHNDHAAGGHGHGDEFNFGEIFIHQAIETIEFVLGMVSNTASYLRLWALSLAHTELAAVFWEKAMAVAIRQNNPAAVVIGYAIFACVTFGVLLAMDVLECFLHALRLHWVEFQNKFYKADGYAFAPFEYKTILESTHLS